MNKIFFTGILVIMMSTNGIFAQVCGCAATDYGSIDVAGWVVGQSGTITTCQWGGERSTIYNTVAGATYRVSTCGAGYDTQLEIFTTGCTFIAYNDDNGPGCAGLAASVDFVSPGGNLYSRMAQFYCATNLTCTNVTIQLLSSPGGPCIGDVTPPTFSGGGAADQQSLVNNTCMATFGQTCVAQSFIPSQNSICGASIQLSLWGAGPGNVTISLYNNLPSLGGILLASGTVNATDGAWAQVSWPSVSVTPGITYYLVFTSSNPNQCIAGDLNNGYLGGQVYANAGYGAWPTYDYTFQTFNCAAGACPGNISTNTSAGVCNASVATSNPSPTDNCAVTVLTWALSGATSGSSAPTGINYVGTQNFNAGVTNITYTAKDAANNSATCSFNITVVDNQNPTITCPANISAGTSPGVCNASVATPNPTLGDNCGVTTLTWVMTGATTGSSPVSGINNMGTQTFNPGLTTVTYTAKDAANNTITCSFTVSISDNQNPTLTCPSNISTSSGVGSCTALVATSNPTTADNCGVSTLIWTMTGATSGSSPGSGINNVGTQNFNSGVTTVTYTLTDASLNTSTCSFTVTVNDAVPPTITCPGNISTSAGAGSCSALVATTSPTTGDNCGVSTLTWLMTGATSGSSPVSGINNVGTQNFNSGVTTVTYTATDAALNTSTCSFTVTVTDAVAPTLTCSANITTSTAAGVCNAAVSTLSPNATDNCFLTTLTWNMTGATTGASGPSGINFLGTQNFNSGVTTVTYTASDAALNTATCSFTVTVSDNQSPVANTIPLPTINGDCSATVTPPGATDNCSGAISGTTLDPLTYTSQGTFNITWTFTDASGNTSVQIQTVVIDDLNGPVPDSSPLPNATGECNVTVSAPTATDGCEGATVGTTLDPTTYSVQGTFNITWTYDDGNGNTTTQTQVVTVDDVTPPVPNAASLPDISNDCTASLTNPPTATDNCEGVLMGTTTDPLTYNTPGNYVVTWTYDDGNGNTSIQTQNVIVTDALAPVPNISPLPPLTAICNFTIENNPTATDNCIGVMNGTTSDPSSYGPGSYIITWTYTDLNGNTATQTQSLVVDPCAGIDESNVSWNVIISPNPGNGIFTLSLSEMPEGKTEIRLLTALGQVIFNGILQSEVQQFDFSYLSAATYYLQISNGGEHITKPIVIKNNH